MIAESITKVKNNPIGAIGGAVLTYWLISKYSPARGILLMGVLTVVGAVAGAMVQSKMSARLSVPTKEIIEG